MVYGGEILKLKGKLIVANTGDDTLSCLDIDKREVIDIIDLKSILNNKNIKLDRSIIGPYELITTENNLIYCTNIYDNSIFKIDMETKEIIDTLYVGSYPTCIKYFNNSFYIVNTDSNSISIVDEKSFSLVENIQVGEKPTDIEIDENNMKVYVANSNGYSINRIDIKKYENIIIKLENNPLKMILEGNHMYILSNVNNSPIHRSNISIMNLETLDRENILDLNGIFNTMLKINGSEIIFTTNIGDGYLYRMNIKNKNLLSKTNLSGIPNKLEWDGNEIVFITNISTNTLTLFDIKTNKIIQNIKVGLEPNGILVFS